MPISFNNFSVHILSYFLGPQPILPRPSTPQTYALIPLSSVNQPHSLPNQQSMFFDLSQSSGHSSTCPSPVISEGITCAAVVVVVVSCVVRTTDEALICVFNQYSF